MLRCWIPSECRRHRYDTRAMVDDVILTLLTKAPAPAEVPLKDVRVPDALFWYMGIIVLVCVVVFFVIPIVLSAKRKRAASTPPDQPDTTPTEAPADADHA